MRPFWVGRYEIIHHLDRTSRGREQNAWGCKICGDVKHWWRKSASCAGKMKKAFKKVKRRKMVDFRQRIQMMSSKKRIVLGIVRNVLFVMRSVMLSLDLKQILDEGEPTSTGEIFNATCICNMLAVELNLEKPREEYLHGWGNEC